MEHTAKSENIDVEQEDGTFQLQDETILITVPSNMIATYHILQNAKMTIGPNLKLLEGNYKTTFCE